MPGRPSSGSGAAPAGELYDVIIAGASFAGLAAARHLRGRVLVIDRQPIGEGVTSACAAPLRIVAMVGAEASVQQVHEALVLHAPGRDVTWPLPEPFCAFDYRRFCLDAAAGAGLRPAGDRGIAGVAGTAGGNGGAGGGGPTGGARGSVEFLQASVLGREGDSVRTSVGAFRGRFLIDATGPRAALAGHGRPRHVAFGIESEVGTRVAPGLHFYFLPEVRDGYAWAFPCGEGTRFGVLSYRGRTKLLPALERFMARFGARPSGVHGGYLATGWTPGVVRGVFVAGDAAGHCLPLSGEGIRTAVLAGMRCGEVIQQVLDGRLRRGDAEAAYRRFVAADRWAYRGLLWGNLVLLGLPRRWVGPAAVGLGRPAIRRWFFERYLGIGRSSGDGVGPVEPTVSVRGSVARQKMSSQRLAGDQQAEP